MGGSVPNGGLFPMLTCIVSETIGAEIPLVMGGEVLTSGAERVLRVVTMVDVFFPQTAPNVVELNLGYIYCVFNTRV